MAETLFPGSEFGDAPRLDKRYSSLQPVVILGLLGEAAIAAGAIADRISLPMMLAGHLAVVLAVALLQLKRLRSCDDGGLALLAVVGMLATGPFGAACALTMPFLTRRSGEREVLLPGWYRRIALSSEQSEFTRLSDRIAIGRAANLAAPLPLPFVELFTSGSVAEQQAALGLIARDFHPGYLPVLKVALDSSEPVIRVQAAAVAARVRGQLNEQVVKLFDRAADPLLNASDAVDLAADLKSSIDSGLLEVQQQSAAISVRDGLLGRTFARLDARRREASTSKTPSSEFRGDDADEAYAAHLLSDGRFEEFRSFRHVVRRPLQGRYRRRIVPLRPIAQRLSGRLLPVAVRR